MATNKDLVFPIPLDNQILEKAKVSAVMRAIPVRRVPSTTVSWLVGGLNVPSAAFNPSIGPSPVVETAGTVKSTTMKYLGYHVRLPIADIIATGNLDSVNVIVPTTEPSMEASRVADEWARELLFATASLVSAVDKTLVVGDSTANPLEFDGIATQLTPTTAFYEDASASAFDINHFNDWLTRLQRATHIFGHPIAIARIYYAALSQSGVSPTIIISGGNVVPGVSLNLTINTSIGQLQLVPDVHFPYTHSGTDFTSTVYVLNVYENGVPLVYQAILDGMPTNTEDYFMLAPEGSNPLYRSAYLFTLRTLVIERPEIHGAYKAKFTGVASPTTARQPIV